MIRRNNRTNRRAESLQVESLETRQLLSANSLLGAGTSGAPECTLRAAIMEVNGQMSSEVTNIKFVGHQHDGSLLNNEFIVNSERDLPDADPFDGECRAIPDPNQPNYTFPNRVMDILIHWQNEELPEIKYPVHIATTPVPLGGLHDGVRIYGLMDPITDEPMLRGLELAVGSDGSTMDGLLLNNFTEAIRIEASDNFIYGNYIGTDRMGVDSPDALALNDFRNTIGIKLDVDDRANPFPIPARNVIGLSDIAQTFVPNVISGNTSHGIDIEYGELTQIRANRVGVDPSAQEAVPNGGNGLRVGAEAGMFTTGHFGPQHTDFCLVTPGGFGSCPNIFSGNVLNGIHVQGDGKDGSQIDTNNIGTNLPNGAPATIAIPNGLWGVRVDGGAQNFDIVNNLISGNEEDGIVFDGSGTTGVRIFDNRIGTSDNGRAAVPNVRSGIRIQNGAEAIMVGTHENLASPTAEFPFDIRRSTGNVISGNGDHGVIVYGVGNDNHIIRGNNIGVSAFDSTSTPLAEPVGNGQAGVFLTDLTSHVTVGGLRTPVGAVDAIPGNNIADNSAGVFLDRNTHDNYVIGNSSLSHTVGTQSTSFGNLKHGVVIEGHHNWIGMAFDEQGSVVTEPNFLFDNGHAGIVVTGRPAQHNKIAGNRIGVDSTGTFHPNGGSGIVLESKASNNEVGHVDAADHTVVSNVIAGNMLHGVQIADSINNRVFNNLIDGRAHTGTVGNGVAIRNGEENVIGSDNDGVDDEYEANRIVNHTLHGIQVESGRFNTFSHNEIEDNGELGINLVGGIERGFATLNDEGDADRGPNDLQNYPILDAVVDNTLHGHLEVAPDSGIYRVEVFGNSSPDPSGHGEGQVYLGQELVDSSLMMAFEFDLISTASYYTATATRLATRETSEFSPAFGSITQDVIGESGRLMLDHQWTTVDLKHTYDNPVVVIGAGSTNDGGAHTFRVKDVTSNSFMVQIDRWDYLAPAHSLESTSYVVMEAGIHQLEDGTLISAGTVEDVTHSPWTTVDISIPGPFAPHFNDPVVFSQTVSVNDPSAVTTRQRAVSVATQTFEVRLQEEEAADGIHGGEDVSWIAIDESVGQSANKFYEAGSTGNVVTHRPQSGNFAASYDAPPVFLAAMQTFDGPDTGVVRYTQLDGSSYTVYIDEEQSANSETRHTTEDVGYWVLDEGAIFGIDVAGGLFVMAAPGRDVIVERHSTPSAVPSIVDIDAAHVSLNSQEPFLTYDVDSDRQFTKRWLDRRDSVSESTERLIDDIFNQSLDPVFV